MTVFFNVLLFNGGLLLLAILTLLYLILGYNIGSWNRAYYNLSSSDIFHVPEGRTVIHTRRSSSRGQR